MKIINGYIEGFGCLCGKAIEFDGGLNALSSENGTGKSTLIAFIKAMLFGIGDTRRTGLLENDRRRYAPWSGAKFGGSLTVMTDGRVFRIERSFGRRPSEDSFRLFDATTGRESKEYGDNVGEMLLRIDADGAERTLFLTEKNLLPSTESPTLSAAISGAVGRATEGDRLDEALLLLDKQRRKYQKRGGGGEIDECREKITDAKRLLSSLEATLESERREKEEIAALSEELASLDTDARELRSRQSELVGKSRPTLTLFLILTLALAAIFATVAVFSSPLFYIAAAVFATMGGVIAIVGTRGRGSKIREDYDRLDGKRSDLDAKKAALTEERAELIRRHEATLDALKGLRETELELSRQTERLSVLEEKLFIIKEAAERLKAANEALAKRHVGGACESFRRYLDIFSESEGLSLDTELKITKTEGGETHPYESYSRATRDLYSFAARLAAADAIFGGRCPLLILDDPFCAFDDKRLSLALDFTRELAKSRQIIYFTASKSRLPR